MFQREMNAISFRRGVKDAFPRLGDAGPIVEIFGNGPFRVPVRFTRSRAGRGSRVEVASLTATSETLTSGERTAWWWHLVTSALGVVGLDTGAPAPDLSAFAPGSVNAIKGFPLSHVQLAPGWGAGSAGGKSVAVWRAIASPFISRVDEELRTSQIGARSALPEQYLWPHPAGKPVTDPAASVPSVHTLPVPSDFYRLSELDAVRRVVVDIRDWWNAISIGERLPLPLAADDTSYSWQSRPASVMSDRVPLDMPSAGPGHLRRWVCLEVTETVEGTLGRLVEIPPSGAPLTGVAERLALPAWVYARGLVGDWIMPSATVVLRQLNPYRTPGAAAQLELPPRASGPDAAPAVASGHMIGETAGAIDDGKEFPDDGKLLGWADPAFRAHFADSVYEDPEGEFAPFGTDEGADLLAEWSERVEELSDDMTVADLLAESGFEGVLEDLDLSDSGAAVPEPGGPIDAATIVVGAAFTLLRLAGRIDPEGRQAALRGLAVLEAAYGQVAELERQRVDLETWRDPSPVADDDEGL